MLNAAALVQSLMSVQTLYGFPSSNSVHMQCISTTELATTEVYRSENVITSPSFVLNLLENTVFYRTQTESLLCIEIAFVRWLTWNIFTSFIFLPKRCTSSDALNTFEFHEDPHWNVHLCFAHTASLAVSLLHSCPPPVDLNAEFLLPKVNVSYYMIHKGSSDSVQRLFPYLLFQLPTFTTLWELTTHL